MKNSVKNKLKRAGTHVSSILRLYLSPMTSPELIRGFIDRLVPRDLGHEMVRIGGSADGGYLVPNDLDNIESCFSPGVADTAWFEAELLERGIPSYLADYSVDGPPKVLANCDFVKKFVGAANTETTISLDRWVAEKCPAKTGKDLILQMDIEGAEYETLLATSTETLCRFRIIVLELHKLNHLDNRLYFKMVDATLRRLLEHFDVAHLHPNNAGGMTRLAGIEIPRVAELTLLRKDRTRQVQPLRIFPHPLDANNSAALPPVDLPSYWWQSKAA